MRCYECTPDSGLKEIVIKELLGVLGQVQRPLHRCKVLSKTRNRLEDAAGLRFFLLHVKG